LCGAGPAIVDRRAQARAQREPVRRAALTGPRATGAEKMFFLSDMLNKKLKLPTAQEALPGRDRPISTATKHHVSKRPLHGPYPEGLEVAYFGMGCFRSEEHTSELQSRENLVCRLLLEKKKEE